MAKFSAKLVANFRRSLEGDFRASFAGKIVRSIFHQNSTANFTIKLHYNWFWVVAGPTILLSRNLLSLRRLLEKCQRKTGDWQISSQCMIPKRVCDTIFVAHGIGNAWWTYRIFLLLFRARGNRWEVRGEGGADWLST